VIVSQSEVVTNKAETKRMETRLQSLSLEEKVSLLEEQTIIAPWRFLRKVHLLSRHQTVVTGAGGNIFEGDLLGVLELQWVVMPNPNRSRPFSVRF